MATRTEIDTLIFYVLDEPNRQLMLTEGLGSISPDVRIGALRGLQDLGWIAHHGYADYGESYSLTKEGRRVVAAKPQLSSMGKCVADHIEAIRALNSSSKDTRIESLKRLIAKECDLGNWDSALMYCHELRETGERDRNSDAIAYSFFFEGRIDSAQNRWDEALECYLNSIEKFMDLGDRKWVCGVNREMGIVYGCKGDHASAMRCFESSLSMARLIEDKDAEIKAEANLAIIYDLEGKPEEAERANRDCLAYFMDTGDLTNAARTANNLGLSNTAREKFQEAAEYFEKTVYSGRSIRSREILGGGLVNAGYCYARTGNTSLALKYTDEAVSIFKEPNDLNMLALSYRNYALIEFRNSNVDQAFKWFEKSVRTARSSGVEDTYAACCYEYGLALIRSLTNIKLAKKLLAKAADTYRAIGNSQLARTAEAKLTAA